MTAHDIRLHPIGFLEITKKPSKEELRIYYAERYFQKNQGNYRVEYSPEERAYIENKLAQRAQIVNKMMHGRVGSMLDVGCGEGFAMAYFHRHGWTVEGMDYSQSGVEAMNPQCMSALTTGDVDTLLQHKITTGRKYDLIWLSNVLEHVPDSISLMSQMHELLNQAGVLVVTVPNDFSPIQRELIRQGHITDEFWVAPPDHLSYFNESSLRRIGAATGYQIQHLIGDFPIDMFLYHPGSNYVTNKSLGPAAHMARVQLENLLAERPIQQINDFYEAMAQVGLGRDLTGFFSTNFKSSSTYSCLIRSKISCEEYSIRTVEPGDIESIRQWRNSQMDVLRQKKEISQEEQLAYYSKYIWPTLDYPYPENILLAYLKHDQLIGYGGLVHIGWEDRRGEVSFLLDPIRTSDKEAYKRDFLVFLSLIKSLAFEDLKLQKLYTETFASREYHIGVLEAAGFSLEGRMRQHVIINGQAIDSLIHGCLKETYAR
jgi:2-polyprenyl-3-methyl-5-hydroxy-6-metoxy-1,4-benzoquinol methylase/RimJ/RimL family protein N-acetyltransferase